MKKIFTLIAVALMGVTAVNAQSVKINKADGTTLTFSSSEIKNIEFLPNAEAPDTVVMRQYTGYITVTNTVFNNTYFGDSARIEVLKVGEKQLCHFHDGTWGDGLFDFTLSNGNISGTGKMTINYQGNTKSYDATLDGKMTSFTISIPGIMGGTTIKWTYGEVPQALKIAGSYVGSNSLMIGGMMGPFVDEDSQYTITANADGTINLTTAEEQYLNTQMGDITLGSYTISNIAYDESTKMFMRKYGADGLKAHLKTMKDGQVGLDGEYSFGSLSEVKLSLGADGQLKIVNSYTLGNMPFGIEATYNGTKK